MGINPDALFYYKVLYCKVIHYIVLSKNKGKHRNGGHLGK